MGFSRQERWNGLPFPSPGGLPNPGIEPGRPALQADSLPSEPPGKPQWTMRPHELKCWILEQRKVYLFQGHASRTGWRLLKRPDVFQGRSFYRSDIWGEGCRCVTLLWLVGGKITGWPSRNLHHQPLVPTTLGLCSSSPWVGVLVPTEELRDL